MNFFIGQRVRLLQYSGEGIITAIVDKNTVEVDMGDDFPFDAHVDELVPVDKTESFLAPAAPEINKAKVQEEVRKMGLGVYELSLLLSDSPVPNGGYRLHLINPEITDAMYVCYAKINHKYTSLGRGGVESGKVGRIADLTKDQLHHIKGFFVQVLLFREGSGHPQQPLVRELRWNPSKLAEKRRQVPAIDADAWILSLRKTDDDSAAIELGFENVGTPVEMLVKKGIDHTLSREELVVDLHIEALVANASSIPARETLDIQMRRVHQVMSDAEIQHYAKVIFIHGVGDGILRREVQKRLRQSTIVKTFSSADQAIYGNGATEVLFK